MNLQKELQKIELYKNLELLANQVVEGFISGMHKSPFHGFSSEFAEHKSYNQGESTRYIDWKLYARTDRLYVKTFEEETNLRCHIILDNSSSMHFPELKSQSADKLNKIGFSALASAALMNLLKRQRDAVGLSVYSDTYEFYAPEKGSERHRQMIISKLEEVVVGENRNKQTRTYTFLHQIAEKIHRRSMIFLFTDMFQTEADEEEFFNALRHLKFNKHEVVLFHVMDKEKELNFGFDNMPRRFFDVETGDHIDLYAENVREAYRKEVENYFERLKMKCARYKIKYVEADISRDIEKILLTYLIERQKFV